MENAFTYLTTLALLAVFLVLLAGLWNMMRGTSPNLSQTLMRWRVGLQFLAIVIAMLLVYLLAALSAAAQLDRAEPAATLQLQALAAWRGRVSQPWSFSTRSTRAPATPASPRSAPASACPSIRLRIAAYGTVDETNAAIGVARIHLAARIADVDAMLGAHPERSVRPRRRPDRAGARRAEGDARAACASATRRSSASRTRSTRSTPSCKPLRSFVLPGGSAAAAALHVARTVCRRAERCMVELAGAAGRARRRAGAQVHQPPVRPPVRRQPLRQRARRRRRALGAGPEPLARLGAASRKPKDSTRGLHSRCQTTIPLRSIRFQWVTVGLIAANVLVFLWQNVPAGQSIGGELRASCPPSCSRCSVFGGSARGPYDARRRAGGLHAPHLHVPARRHHPPRLQHAVPVGVRRQRRGRHGAHQVPGLLSALRHRRRPGARLHAADLASCR